MRPGIPLRELDANQGAIRALEDGADTVTNEFHRVDRIGALAPQTRRKVDAVVRLRGCGLALLGECGTAARRCCGVP